jgi:hypothetical protein
MLKTRSLSSAGANIVRLSKRFDKDRNYAKLHINTALPSSRGHGCGD